MTRVHFPEVSVKRTFRWKDPVTGKPRQETKVFSQTINPFNRNAAGRIKMRGEITAELEREAYLWLLRKENEARDAAQRQST
jgi:hypothetical protein